jgi:hypothetical protein
MPELEIDTSGDENAEDDNTTTSMPELETDRSCDENCDSSIEADIEADIEAPSSPSIESSLSSELIMDNVTIESDDEKPILYLNRKRNITEKCSITSTLLSESNIRIKIKFKDMPVLMLFQEAADGTMDELLHDEASLMNSLLTPSNMTAEMGSCDSLDNIVHITRIEREQRWAAWLAQIIAVLSQLQGLMCFCHNDLHTNNIVWTKTSDQFMYYETNAGKVFKVPTYGKRFHLIDFGRSTFALGDKIFLSDDFFPGNAAHGQYNYDVCTDHENPDAPYIEPNMSFDLSRLSTSMLYMLYEETPARRYQVSKETSAEDQTKPKTKGKGKHSTANHKRCITESDLYNSLLEWVTDDDGNNIIEESDGEAQYPGFELYIQIAHHIHNAVPKDQWEKIAFKQFETSVKPQSTVKLYF